MVFRLEGVCKTQLGMSAIRADNITRNLDKQLLTVMFLDVIKLLNPFYNKKK